MIWYGSVAEVKAYFHSATVQKALVVTAGGREKHI